MRLQYACADVDELAGALALGAVDADELRAAREHLATCAEPHAELRSLIGADAALAAGLDPIQPSPGLRDRLMTTVGEVPRESTTQPAGARQPSAEEPARRGWLDWLSPNVARPLAVAAVVALIAVGIWGLSLSAQLGEQQRALDAVAQAISDGQTAHRVEGEAGRGYLVDTPGSGASFVVTDVSALDPNQLYELWLIGPDGTPVAAGTFEPTSAAVAVVPVEDDLAGFQTFAVTVESERVDAPTGDPVMVGDLTG
jgi:anti-sigma-K factor RskA